MDDFNWVLMYVLIFALIGGVMGAIYIYKRVKLDEQQLILGSTIIVAIGVILIACLNIPMASITSTYPDVFKNDKSLMNLFIIGFILLELMVLCSIFGLLRFFHKIREKSFNVVEGRLSIEKKFLAAQALLGVWLILLFTVYYWDFWSHTPYTNFDHINDLFALYYSGSYTGNPFQAFIYALLIEFAISQGFYVAGPPLLSELMHKLDKDDTKLKPVPRPQVAADVRSEVFEDYVDSLPFEAYHGEKPYLFVSYSHKDKPKVYPIIQRMHQEQIRIWYDEGIPPSGKWIEQIASTLKSCDMFLIFITPNAVSSKHVRNEIYYANKNDKKIFPIYLEKTTLPDELDIQIGRFQALFKYLMDDGIFWKKLLEQLIKVAN